MHRFASRLTFAFFAVLLPALASSAEKPPAGPSQLLVKLRPAFAAEVELSFGPEAPARLAAEDTAPAVRPFLDTHALAALRPLYPALLQERLASGRTHLERARARRQRFPARARRFRGAFQPPDLTRTYVMEPRPGAPLAQLLEALRRDPAVEHAEIDRPVSVQLVPNDPYFSTSGSWGQAYDDLYGLKKIGAPAAWDRANGQGVVVAVVDTGIQHDHPDLAANAWRNSGEVAGNGLDDDGNGFVDDVRGWDFIGQSVWTPVPDADPRDGHGHGTHVAGTVAAVGNDGLGVVGVAWGARVMAVKGLDDYGSGLFSTLAPALVYAADNGADVINNSWGGPGPSSIIADAVSYAHQLGAVVVAAAGNSSQDARSVVPAALPEAITVAASGPDDSLAFFTNWGPKIDVAAPGVDILSLGADGSAMGDPVGTHWRRASGTSMASPHVAGVAALLLSRHPTIGNEQVRSGLRATAADLGEAGVDQRYGYGRVDAAAAAALSSVLEATITGPAEGASVQGPVAVTGRARGTGFARYVLDYGYGQSPASWTVIQEGSGPVVDAALGVFDPGRDPDGVYTLRLTAINASGQRFVDLAQVRVDYVAFTDPAPPLAPVAAAVKRPGLLTVTGRATGPRFRRYWLEWAAGINPTSGWADTGVALSTAGTAPATGTVATWDASTIGTGYFTLRLLVENEAFTSEARTLVFLQDGLMPGSWPVRLDKAAWPDPMPVRDRAGVTRLTLPSGHFWGSAAPSRLWQFTAGGEASSLPLVQPSLYSHAVGELDGQPGEDVAFIDQGGIKVLRGDGSAYELTGSLGGLDYSSVLLDDLDGDGRLEVIALTDSGVLQAWRRDGINVEGFPVFLPGWPARARFGEVRVWVADLEGDGAREILAAVSTNDLQATQVYRYDANGRLHPSWSPRVEGTLRSVALGDLDRDGRLEVALLTANGTAGRLHVLQSDGAPRPGWPREVGYASGNVPTVVLADLDRNGRLEVLAAVDRRLHVLSENGTPFSPSGPIYLWASSPTFSVADVDGDGKAEILTVSEGWESSPDPLFPDGTALPDYSYATATLLALRPDGSMVRSWSLLGANDHAPFAFGNSPVVGDFDHDGRTDIAVDYALDPLRWGSGGAGDGVVTVFALGTPFRSEPSDWPCAHHDRRNTDRVGGAPPPSIRTAASAVAGQRLVAEVGGGPGHPTDWIALARRGAPDTSYLDWAYLDGGKTPPTTGADYAAVAFTASALGEFEFRLFARNGFSRLATSAPFSVNVALIAASSSAGTAGQVVAAIVSSGPGNATDWVALARVGAPDDSQVAWRYLNGLQTPPTSGLSEAQVPFTLPAAAGTYELRLFASNGYTRLATSGPITVTVPPPVLAPHTVSATPGQEVQVDVIHAGAGAADWIALARVGASRDHYLSWMYLNGLQTAPATPVTATTASFTAPAAGLYEFRLFANNGFSLLAASLPLTVTSVASVAASTASSNTGQVLQATVAGGPANAADWVALALVGAPDTSFADWKYLNGQHTPPATGLAAASVPFVPATPGVYELRLFANDSFLHLAHSAPIQVAAPGPNVLASTTSAEVFSTVQAVVVGGPASRTDWIALARVGDPDGVFVAWAYLNGGHTPPAVGLSSATVPFTLPAEAGPFEFRLYAANGFTRLARSAAIRVVVP